MQVSRRLIENCGHQPPYRANTIQGENDKKLLYPTEDDENLYAQCDGFQPKEGEEVKKYQPCIVDPNTDGIICLALTCQFNQSNLNTVKEIPHELIPILFEEEN
ncbi:MAG: hypothetical protein ABII10_02195 [Candidatus Paceibacterota bacterium]